MAQKRLAQLPDKLAKCARRNDWAHREESDTASLILFLVWLHVHVCKTHLLSTHYTYSAHTWLHLYLSQNLRSYKRTRNYVCGCMYVWMRVCACGRKEGYMHFFKTWLKMTASYPAKLNFGTKHTPRNHLSWTIQVTVKRYITYIFIYKEKRETNDILHVTLP